MKIYPIIHTADSRNWCGPAAVSAITGVHTAITREAIKEAIKELEKTNRRLHGGVYADEILKCLEMYGYEWKELYSSRIEKAPSVATTLHHFKPSDSIFLMIIKENKSTYSHFIVTDGEKIIDSYYPNGIDFWRCVHMDHRVLKLWEIKTMDFSNL